MRRRELLKRSALGLSALAFPQMRLHAASEYEGRFLVTIQCRGGWDVTSFCDPKMNTPGERIINHWAEVASAEKVGNLPYAPFGDNANFFSKHHNKMLVINGVDAQTNSHTTGIIHNWTGRNALGYPTPTGMFAALHGSELPISYITTGGFNDGAGLVRYSNLSDTDTLMALLQPNSNREDQKDIRRPSDIARIQQYQLQRLERLQQDGTLMPREVHNLAAHISSLTSRDSLDALKDSLEAISEFKADVSLPFGHAGVLLREAQLALLAFASGSACAADLVGGYAFDSHDGTNDVVQDALFAHIAEGIDYLWTFADELGIADRITLMIGSDFGRTNHYNAGNGKDHHPIGSFIIMEANPAWGNRVVGYTDEIHYTTKINPTTMQRDEDFGTIIYPKHVHKALRRYLGIENTWVDENFPFTGAEDFDFFNPELSTPQLYS